MKVRILRKVPLLMNGSAYQAQPGEEINGLSDDVVASLLRGGDAEEVVAAPAANVGTPGHPVAATQSKWSGKKNRGAAPENK